MEVGSLSSAVAEEVVCFTFTILSDINIVLWVSYWRLIIVNVPKYLKAIFVECYHPYFPSILNKDYMEEIKKAGIKVNPYTVNNVEDMKKVIEVGVNSIITNEVELLHALIME